VLGFAILAATAAAEKEREAEDARVDGDLAAPRAAAVPPRAAAGHDGDGDGEEEHDEDRRRADDDDEAVAAARSQRDVDILLAGPAARSLRLAREGRFEGFGISEPRLLWFRLVTTVVRHRSRSTRRKRIRKRNRCRRPSRGRRREEKSMLLLGNGWEEKIVSFCEVRVSLRSADSEKAPIRVNSAGVWNVVEIAAPRNGCR
jgi:hypothetical protein